MAVETMILRFRDLVTDPSETITTHRAIIERDGYAWWAWWSKLGETVPSEVFAELNRQTSAEDPLTIYLMDSGQDLVYEAKCARIRWEIDLERHLSPEPAKTPDYYKEKEYRAWFKLTFIAKDPVRTPADVLNGLKYERVDAFFTSGESQYSVFYGKRVYSPEELRRQDRTIWFVRSAEAGDALYEIALLNARTTRPLDFVATPIRAASPTFLWLSDVHIDASGEHHTFALEPHIGRRMLGRALEEDVQYAGVTELGGVIVSGDLTWKATDEDYDHVKTTMRTIQSWSGLSDPASFVVIPGNHDLAFSANPASKDEPVSFTAEAAKTRYERFYADFFQRGPNEFLAMGRRFLIEDSRVVDIVALNTSLLQQHADIFQGQGYVGDAQLTLVASEMGWQPENVEARARRVLVLHHHVMPVLSSETPAHGRQYSLLLDAGAVLRWAVMHRVDLILHGHMHQPYCGRITLPLATTGDLTETHTMGLAALPSTGVSGNERGEFGQNAFGLLDFYRDGVRVRIYPISATTRRNMSDPPFLEQTFPWGSEVMKLLITDMDNTLYDWVGFYAQAFDAMADALVDHLHIPKNQLLGEFKAAHQRYANSEQPFAVLELPSVQERYPNLSRAERAGELDSVLHAFNSARRKYLKLYPGVEDTLRSLRHRGITIVAHTEAIVENAYYRLSHLDIVDYFSGLYALQGAAVEHPEPARAAVLKPPPDFVHVLPPEERKPNPRLLLDICRRENVDPRDCWYVGDSLTRDVTMAIQGGCVAVWARYGTNVDPADWQKLVRITHWTNETVARDEELRRVADGIAPDYTIDFFNELVQLATNPTRPHAKT